MVKAIARAFRWREMLEDGTHATIAEIAVAEKINGTYVGRVLRLTLLAPDIIDAILFVAATLADVHERPILITARKVIGSNSTRRKRVLWFHFMNARVSGTAYGMERGGNC